MLLLTDKKIERVGSRNQRFESPIFWNLKPVIITNNNINCVFLSDGLICEKKCKYVQNQFKSLNHLKQNNTSVSQHRND